MLRSLMRQIVHDDAICDKQAINISHADDVDSLTSQVKDAIANSQLIWI